MSETDQIAQLLVVAKDLLARAEHDPALAERLLSAPRAVIVEEAGRPFPDGIDMQVGRDATGTLHMRAVIDDAYEGEFDDALLESLSGGMSTALPMISTNKGGQVFDMMNSTLLKK